MAIEISTIEKVKYPPELLPQSTFVNITANQEASPPILDLRRFPGKLLRLSEIAVVRDPEVELRIKADDYGLLSNYNVAGGLFDLASTVTPAANNFQMLAKDRLYYNLFATADKPNFRTSFGVWVSKLTVADKLKLGIPLTPEEKGLNEKFGVSKSVEKGILPLPLEEQIKREYRSQLISEETHGRTMAVTTTSQIIETIYPKTNHCLILTKLAATPEDAADNIRISISRDGDVDYITNLKSFAVGLDRELSMFIPALSELKLTIISDEAAGVTTSIRFTIWRCRMTNLLRCRFGLLTKEEAPGDVFDKVQCGIL